MDSLIKTATQADRPFEPSFCIEKQWLVEEPYCFPVFEENHVTNLKYFEFHQPSTNNEVPYGESGSKPTKRVAFKWVKRKHPTVLSFSKGFWDVHQGI